jgi:hypothetical protein
MWPCKAMCEEIVATLKEKEFSCEYVHKCFKTGHGVFENKDARQLVIDFIRKYYKDKTEARILETKNLTLQTQNRNSKLKTINKGEI